MAELAGLPGFRKVTRTYSGAGDRHLTRDEVLALVEGDETVPAGVLGLNVLWIGYKRVEVTLAVAANDEAA